MKYIKPLLAILLISIFVLSACSDKKKKDQNEDKNVTEKSKTEKPKEGFNADKKQSTKPLASQTDIPIDTLLGRWLRPDGNYVIQINSIDAENQIDAQYFNPKPIKVARAERIPGDNFRIFIEFDDKGYEGSSYDLVYDPVNDALNGKYFQATYGQTYQIGFIRLKE